MDPGSAGAPRLAPTTVSRPRLQRWLDAYAGYPVRFIIAPAASGKTTLLLRYIEQSHRDPKPAYCVVPEKADPATLFEAIARAFGWHTTPRSYTSLVRSLNRAAKNAELVVDNADSGTPETSQILLQLVDDTRIPLVFAARSRDRLRVRGPVARGLGVLCDARRLAFDAADARALTDACGADASEHDLSRLIQDTDGWALAVAGAIRVAAAEHTTIRRGYELWREETETFLRDFFNAELARLPDLERDLFWRLYAGAPVPDLSRLRDLEFHGMHVLDEGRGVMRLYRPLHPLGAPHAVSSESDEVEQSPLFVRMLLEFEARIGHAEIPWVRRRDQQIIKYLLLKPDGRATREELAKVFWPDTERHLATQSVRTACSTIRKALAAVVGPSNVHRYFRTTPDVQIDLDRTVCDVRRFLDRIAEGDAAFDTDGIAAAAPHYRAAEKLYRGDLLGFEGQEPWFAAGQRALRDRVALARTRLSNGMREVVCG